MRKRDKRNKRKIAIVDDNRCYQIAAMDDFWPTGIWSICEG